MRKTKLFVNDTVIEQILQVYGDNVIDILEAKKREGFQIVFTDDFGRPHSEVDPLTI